MFIIYAILAFSSLIIIHELGHFVVAKINGVGVVEFSIGMGPKIVSISGKETKYSIGILPIGGYVQLEGAILDEEDEEEIERIKNSKTNLNNKRPLQKISVMIAGVIMNVLLGIVLFAMIANHSGYITPSIGKTVNGSPAQEAGLKPGDIIKKINGSTVYTFKDIIADLSRTKGKSVTLEVERDNKIQNINVIPKLNEETKSYEIGIYFGEVVKPTISESIDQGFKEAMSMVKQTVISVKMLVTGKGSFTKDVGGPVTIIKMTGEAAKMGIWPLLNLTALLSINLAVINFLPFPALDGGRCLMYIFEMITRIKVPQKVEDGINAVGMILLMGLMLIVTLKDIFIPINL